MAAQGKVTVIDSTIRLEWEVTKEEFDNCEFEVAIYSPVYDIPVGDKESEWRIELYPKGEDDGNKDKAQAYLELLDEEAEDELYKVRFQIAVKTPTGYWPTDFVEVLYSKHASSKEMLDRMETLVFDQNIASWGYPLGSTKKIEEMFIQNKITLVTTMAIYIEGKNYLKHRDMTEEFVRDMRTIPDHDDMFYDLTVICGDKQLKSNKALLASRSLVFGRMLETDMTEKIKGEINITDVKPDIMNDILDYLSNGLIPNDFDNKAVEMIHAAEKYKLDALMKACENSLADNLAVDTVINTLITVDLYVPKSVHRQKILDFINSNAAQVIKTKDWMEFLQKYPKLATELYMAAAAPKQN